MVRIVTSPDCTCLWKRNGSSIPSTRITRSNLKLLSNQLEKKFSLQLRRRMEALWWLNDLKSYSTPRPISYFFSQYIEMDFTQKSELCTKFMTTDSDLRFAGCVTPSTTEKSKRCNRFLNNQHCRRPDRAEPCNFSES